MWALLPLKNFANAKLRLSSLLTPTERSELSAAMVNDVLSVLQSHPDIDNTLIVSDELSAEPLARQYGAQWLSESSLNACGLNEAVQAGVDDLARRGIDEVMVIHGDLPLISHGDISDLIQAHRKQSLNVSDLESSLAEGKAAEYKPTLTIAPDEGRKGTNCLLCTPASSLTYRYGPNSFTAHAINASHINMAFQVVCLPRVACDIDEAEDLAQLLQQASPERTPHCHRYIETHNLLASLRARDAEWITDTDLQYGGIK